MDLPTVSTLQDAALLNPFVVKLPKKIDYGDHSGGNGGS